MTNYTIIQITDDFHGNRYSTKAGDIHKFRHGGQTGQAPHSNVFRARAGQSINVGGAMIKPDRYKILFDGQGQIPAQYKD